MQEMNASNSRLSTAQEEAHARMEEDEWDDEVWSHLEALETHHLLARAAPSVASHTSAHAAAGAATAFIQPAPTVLAATPSSTASWACQSCTLVNAASRTTCLVCRTPRGQTLPPPHVMPPAPQPASGPPLHPPRKTVQAVLPFGRTGSLPERVPAQPQPRASPPAVAQPWPVPRVVSGSASTLGSGQRLHRPSPLPMAQVPRQQQTLFTAAAPSSSSSSSSSSSQRSPALLPEDDSNGANAAVTSLEMALANRQPGEDAIAKTRYSTDTTEHALAPPIDPTAAHSFIYPTNYAVREYQLVIAERALYHNTLVSLPTGLGKTLIAAVVMYNFYRWFPRGQVVFMAPTKPLVAQQVQACHEIMGIPLSDTAEMQGSVPPAQRHRLWKQKRVFYCTPQSLQNDLQRGLCRAEQLVCLVLDEAHRATGQYAYCNVIQAVERKTRFFRVLALSATPGAKFDVIQDVIRNLRITHIESRSADDADVKKYTHARQEEVIKCRLGEQLSEVKALFMRVFLRILQRLAQANIIQNTDPDRISRWYVLQARERFRHSDNYAARRSAESDLALLIRLLHARDLLTVHGLGSFREYVDAWVKEAGPPVPGQPQVRLSWSKKEMLQSTEFQALRLSLESTQVGTDGANVAENARSHPKLLKLREVLQEHFQRHAAGSSSTRAIVFTQYRTSVMEIVALLTPLAPLLKVQPFVGQGASGKAKESKGQSQKQQKEIVRKFRAGEFNVLVATCIAEEGLDIGEVDLIVSFDALTSPVRMIQRMGRTGRKRVGKVIILVTEGEEEKKLARSVAAAKTVSRALTTFKSKFEYATCPRMIPAGITPELTPLEMQISEFHASQVGGGSRAMTSPSSVSAAERIAVKKRNEWKLNEMELSIARTKYFTTDLKSRPRRMFTPVIASRLVLLRRNVPLMERRHGLSEESEPSQDVDSETRTRFGARSRILRAVVRRIHGAPDEEDALYDELVGGRLHERLLARQRQPFRAHDYPVVVETTTRSGGDSVDIDSGRGQDTADLHFSPQYTNHMPMTPPDTDTMPSETTVTRIPSTPPDVAKEIPETRITGRVALLSALSSPSPNRRKRRGSVGSNSSTPPTKKNKVSPLRSRGDKSPSKRRQSQTDTHVADSMQLLERGELLLKQLTDLVANDSQLSPPSPPPSVTASPDAESVATSPCDDNTKLQQVATANPDFPRITRRLRFDGCGGESTHPLSLANGNCVPLPPCLPFKVRHPASIISTAPVPITPVVTNAALNSGRDISCKPTGVVQERNELGLNSSATMAPSVEEAAGAGNCPLQELPFDNPRPANSKSPGFQTPIEVPRNVHGNLPTAMSKPRRSLALRRVDTSNVSAFHSSAKKTEVDITKTTEVGTTGATAVNSGQMLCSGDEESKQQAHRAQDRPSPGSNSPSSQVKRASQSKSSDGSEDACSICREQESFDDDPIVFCDGCDVAVHQFCYGIPALPSENWFCDPCTSGRTLVGSAANKKNKRIRCALCPMSGVGAIKRTECGHWVHVQCFMWIPELQFHYDEVQGLLLGSLSRLDPDRLTLSCSLCHSKGGRKGGATGIIQCAHKRCLTSFHVSCAACADYPLVQEQDPAASGQSDNSTDSNSVTLFLMYCPRHSYRRGGDSATTTVPPERQQPVRTPNVHVNDARGSNTATPPKLISPSALLLTQTTPQGETSKKERKRFRRLKRRYSTTPSDGADGSSTSHGHGSVADGEQLTSVLKSTPTLPSSQWGKSMRRSQQHHAHQKQKRRRQRPDRNLVRMFFEDEVDAPSDTSDGEDEDGDRYDMENSFINDTSQLMFSPTQSLSAAGSTPGSATTRKRKRRRTPSPGEMRAIYARSLVASPETPEFLRRGRRLGGLPKNGIIAACLEAMNSGSGADSATDEGSEREEDGKGETQESATRIGSIIKSSALSGLGDDEGNCNDTAIPASIPAAVTVKNETILSAPSFDLLAAASGSGSTLSETIGSTSSVVRSQAYPGDSSNNFRAEVSDGMSAAGGELLTHKSRHDSDGEKEKGTLEQMRLAERMEANRQKALERLRAKQLKAAGMQVAVESSSRARIDIPPGPTTTGSRGELRLDVEPPPQFNLLGTITTTAEIVDPCDASSYVNNHDEMKLQSMVGVSVTPEIRIVVSPGFAQSPVFAALSRHTENISSANRRIAVETAVGTLEADLVISSRVGALCISETQWTQWSRVSAQGDVRQHDQVRVAFSVFKKVMIVIVARQLALVEGDVNIDRLRAMPACVEVVIVSSDSLASDALIRMIRSEFQAGFALPSPTVGDPTGCQALDANFVARVAFFRKVPTLSLGAALSLSFRFNNFDVQKIPVQKFNEMHWRRMLPWITESSAAAIYAYFCR